MPGTKRPRKRFRMSQARVTLDPLAKLQPVSAERRELVIAGFRSALDTMVRGREPGEHEWRMLADAVNTIETLVDPMGLLDAAQTAPTIEAAKVALAGAGSRWRAAKGMRLGGAGLQALRDVIDLYESASAGFSLHAMDEARRITSERMTAALRGESPPGVEVVKV